MNTIHATNRVNELELETGISSEASWHAKFANSSYIYAGGFSYELTEGDIIAVFSQFGEIVDINLCRDPKTGKSKGFCFLQYEDQRSTVLAVDNLNGAELLGRKLRVDHKEMFSAPKPKKGEEEQPPPPKIDVLAQAPKHLVEKMERDAQKQPSGMDRRTAELPVNPDERWAAMFEAQLQREQQEEQGRDTGSQRHHHHHHRSHRHRHGDGDGDVSRKHEHSDRHHHRDRGDSSRHKSRDRSRDRSRERDSRAFEHSSDSRHRDRGEGSAWKEGERGRGDIRDEKASERSGAQDRGRDRDRTAGDDGFRRRQRSSSRERR